MWLEKLGLPFPFSLECLLKNNACCLGIEVAKPVNVLPPPPLSDNLVRGKEGPGLVNGRIH